MKIYSIAIHALLLLPAAAVLCNGQEAEEAHKNELAFGLGGLPSISRSDAPRSLTLGPGVGLQVNYGRRLVNGRKAALYGEVHFLASPLRDVSSSVGSATRDVASLYVTPGVRVKFFPTSAISPYVAIGGGYAGYEQSTTQLSGQPNPASRELARGAFDFGAGFDVHVWRFIAFRGEARDFYTGSPNYNLATLSGGQHNVVASGAFVIRWH
jgi:outer membrane protein with beta-barrel domain